MKLLKHCLFYVLMLYGSLVQAQCINTFPYTEDFETSNGNWTSGGTGNDWAWGQVSKSVISQAFSGNNCWVTGGLTTSFYNFNERSYLQSPCFDFTNMVSPPYISFQIWWESENIYDGANLQYSTDAITWINVGLFNGPADCMTQNWYNTADVNNLTNLAGVKHGWSGNSQNTQGSCQGGNGSNGWKLAKHCLSNLAGLPQVYFRFTFGAGTTCNNYDGIAIDDITIAPASFAAPDFTYTCTGNSVSFNVNTVNCANNFQWNFGDGSTATGQTASHTYATGGIKSVTLSVNGLCNATYSRTNPIEILEVNTSTIAAGCSGGNNGIAIAIPVSTGGPFTYQWNTTPVQTTDTAFNLSPGTYNVTVSATGACPGTATAIISAPATVTTTLAAVPDTCLSSTGSIAATTTGGTGPYQYLWSNGATTANISNIQQGNYTLTVTDAASCSITAQADVGYTSGLSFQVETKNVTCFGSNDGKVSIQVSGGQGPYSYIWSNNANTAGLQKLPEGVYTLTVTDSKGCMDSTQLEIEKEQCESYVDFPTGFSPNGDGVNDVFRARYSPDVKKFNMRIYNRWGELVFAGNDILEGWNGTYKNVAQPIGTFVWLAEYSFMDGTSNTSSGNVTLLR